MTDTSLTQAAVDCRRILNGFRQFDEVARALEAAASLEQRVTELTTSAALLTEQRDALQVEIQAAQGGIEAAKAEAERIVDEADRQAAARIANANDEAEAITSRATADAERIASSAAEAMTAGANAVAATENRRDALQAEVADLEQRAAAAREFLAGLTAKA